MALPSPEHFLPLSPASLAILLAVAGGDQHGYGILKEVASHRHAPRLGTGTLYAALLRLSDEGLIAEVDRPSSGDDQRRRYYRLTPLGRRVVRAETLRLGELLALAQSRAMLPRDWRLPAHPPVLAEES